MAKVLSSTAELEKKRKSLLHKVGWGSFFAFLIIVLLGAAYVLIAIHARGSYVFPSFTKEDPKVITWVPYSWLEWGDKLPYFDEVTAFSLFDFSEFTNNTTIYRWCVIGGIVVVGIIFCLIVNAIAKASAKKKFKKLYTEVLTTLTKQSNGLEYKEVQQTSVDFSNSLLRSINSTQAKVINNATYTENNTVLNAIQYVYTLNGKERNGYLFQINLEKNVTFGLLQFRSYGSLSMTEYDGQPIKKLGFAEGDDIYDFICYTSLGENVYRVVDSQITRSVSNLHQYVPSGICVNVENNILSIFLDGFRLNLTRPVNKKLPQGLLEKQALALNALYDKVVAVSLSFCKDIGSEAFIRPLDEAEKTSLETEQTETIETHQELEPTVA